MQPFSLQITPLQLKVVSGITHNPFFKQRLIARTHYWDDGTTIRFNETFYTINRKIGEGLISVVYEAADAESGEIVALKRARLKSKFFQEILRLEQLVTNLMASKNGALGVLPIWEMNNYTLLKPLCTFPTLQELLFHDNVTLQQEEALENCLRFCQELYVEHHLLLDLSPKNISWNGTQWILIDAGPKIHQSDFKHVLELGTWKSDLNYVQSRVTTEHSAPSVLKLSVDAYIPKETESDWVFISEWWDWFPVDKNEPVDYFFSSPSSEGNSDAFIYHWNSADHELNAISPTSNHPLVQRLAVEAWQTLFNTEPPEALSTRLTKWLFDEQNEPINRTQFITEIKNSGIGKRLKELYPERAFLPRPTLATREYRHWQDILNYAHDHTITDIFCHNPLPVPKVLNSPRIKSKSVSLTPPNTHTFAEIELFGSNKSGRAVLIIPGFRATKAAAYALINELNEQDIAEQFIVAEIGVLNTEGSKLVSAGRWELVLLWEIIEYCLNNLELKTIDIIAASHGAIGAWFVSCIHPAVRKIALDSPLLQPMKIIDEMAKRRNEPAASIKSTLKNTGMPHDNFAIFQEPPRGLDVLTMRPEKDLFGQLCGQLEVGQCVQYKGGHAATLRHDSGLIGIPEVCIQSIYNFLK